MLLNEVEYDEQVAKHEREKILTRFGKGETRLTIKIEEKKVPHLFAKGALTEISLDQLINEIRESKEFKEMMEDYTFQNIVTPRKPTGDEIVAFAIELDEWKIHKLRQAVISTVSFMIEDALRELIPPVRGKDYPRNYDFKREKTNT